MNKSEKQLNLIKKLCEQYKFRTIFARQNDNFFYEVYAKNTDDKEVIWFDIQLSNHDSTLGLPFIPKLTIYGNTDQNNLWFSQTRKDLSIKDIIYFCQQMAEICDCKLTAESTNKENELYIHRLVDIEDLQEFKDFTSHDEMKKLVNLKLNDKLEIIDVVFDLDDFGKNLNTLELSGSINFYDTLEHYEKGCPDEINEFLFDYHIKEKDIFNIQNMGDRDNEEIESLVMANKEIFIKEFEIKLLDMINKTISNDEINIFDMYKNMPECYKNHLEDLYTLDGIYTPYPEICDDDAKFLYSICQKNENENVNPFSISHFLTDNYIEGNLSKVQLENANSGEIASAVYYDDLDYFDSVVEEKEVDICD